MVDGGVVKRGYLVEELEDGLHDVLLFRAVVEIGNRKGGSEVGR